MSTSSPPVKSCKPPVRALASGHVLDLPALLVPAFGGPQVGLRAPLRHTDDASVRPSELRAYLVDSTLAAARKEERVVHVPAWRRHPVERAGITVMTLLLARDGGACKRGGGWWGVVGLGLGLGFGFGLRVARALARRHARVRVRVGEL